MAITKKDPTDLFEKFQNVLMDLFSIISFAAIDCYVGYLNFWCFLLYALFFIVIFGFQCKSLKKEGEKSENEKRNADSASSIMNQIYRGILDVKVLNLKQIVFRKYSVVLDSEVEEKEKNVKTRNFNRLFCNIAFEIYTLAFLILGIYMMNSGKMEVGVFISIYLYRFSMYSLVFNVADMRSEMTEIKVIFNRIKRILEISSEKWKSSVM